jgi:small lipoprotein (TIGR04452 family)
LTQEEVYTIMKKKLSLFIILLTVSNCYIFDTINFTYPWDGVIKGDEAKDQIYTSALIGVAADRDDADDLIALVSAQLTGINDSRYYLKEDIDKCANDALLINFITVDIGGYTCEARERKIIIDPIL